MSATKGEVQFKLMEFSLKQHPDNHQSEETILLILKVFDFQEMNNTQELLGSSL